MKTIKSYYKKLDLQGKAEFWFGIIVLIIDAILAVMILSVPR